MPAPRTPTAILPQLLTWALLAACHAPAPAPLAPEELRRRALVEQELAAGRRTEIRFDSAALLPHERAMLPHLVQAAQGIEELFLRQRGAFEWVDAVEDEPSRALYFRNLGPWCEAPSTRDDPDCSALASRPPRRSGVYPPEVQVEGFCDALQAEHPELFTPFTALVKVGDSLQAVPYSKRWPEATARVSAALMEAAGALDGVAEEAPLAAYLRAAAAAFLDDDWFAADAAWVAMNQDNSRWYLRVGPDEPYFDPCGRHAGFHLSLARVSQDGRRWQERLVPVLGDMELAFAAMAGPRYQARAVGFKLPEFIEIVLNAGDSRNPTGATVGQSLPNWGPVADAGGRTVAMTNLGTDPASLSAESAVMDALFCPGTRELWPSEPGPQLGSTVLHEAAHNLGPIGGYRVDGRSDEEVFGGSGAALVEELKAQTASLYFPPWLAQRGILPQDEVLPMAMGDIAWAFGQIKQGFWEGDGSPKVYAQLSAIQLGWLNAQGALRWEAQTMAANGADRGCFAVDPARLGPAVDSLAAEVLRIEGEMDRAGLEALVQANVVGDPMAAWDIVAERAGRQPAPSYVYVIDGQTFGW